MRERTVHLKLLFLILLSFFPVSLNARTTFFWEETKTLSSGDARFPRTVETNDAGYVFYEEVDTKNNQIWLSARIYKSVTEYTDKKRFAGPFEYSGEVPDIYSAAATSKGHVIVAVSSGLEGITVFSSNDKLESLKQVKVPNSQTMIAPRLFVTSSGTVRLFTSVIQEDLFQLFSADTKDGVSWTNFRRFNPGAQFKNPFLPVLIPNGSSDIVVFQAQYSSQVLNRFSYQLFVTTTRDGSSWSTPVLLTDQASLPESDIHNFAAYQNQRPDIIRFNGKVFLVWERTETVTSELWMAEITSSGLVPRTSRKITERGNASRAQFFLHNNNLFLTWFDTRNGNEAVYLAEKAGEDWEELAFIENSSSNMFSTPLFIPHVSADGTMKKELGIISQRTTKDSNFIMATLPDAYVAVPRLSPVSFRAGHRGREKNVRIQINYPSDVSGIKGYAYTWGKDNELEPDETQIISSKDRTLDLTADEDGTYVLNVKICDYAGNWSKAESLTYIHDITPPASPVLKEFQTDEYGFSLENTFKFEWDAPQDEDVAGYNYELEYLGSIPKKYAVNKTHSISEDAEKVTGDVEGIHQEYADELAKEKSFKSMIMSYTRESKIFNNKENGVYKFSVAAIDEVGNVGPSTSVLIILNKYSPQTFIESAYQKTNDIGEIELVINGGGFTYEGTISHIYIDKDGAAPYDLILSLDKGDFRVKEDGSITNVKIGTELDEGSYKVGLLHTDRGLFFSGNLLYVSKNGTVKIESQYEYKPRYKFAESNYRFTIVISVIILLLLIILGVLILLMIAWVLLKKKKENSLIFKEINSLISGDIMPLLKKSSKKNDGTKRSLRGKLVGFTIVLVIVVTLFVTLQNGVNMVQSQQKTMTDALQNRIDVLLESLSTGVKNFLPTENDLEIGALPAQKDAMAEAKYVTILGEPNSSNENPKAQAQLAYIWATNDPDIEMKVSDYGQNGIIAGETYATDEKILNIINKFSNLNQETAAKVSDVSAEIAKYSAEITRLAASSDRESVLRRSELSSLTTRLRSELNATLSQIAAENSNSYPAFNYDILSSDITDYIFYKPVMYRSGTSNTYVHGVIIMEISIQSLVDELHDEIQDVIFSATLAAIAALILGSLGAWLLASLIVKPIKRLESHLEHVGSLMTKSVRERQRLEKEHIEISSKDEIGRLGDVVNKMTLSAGLAAYEEFLQLDGKAVQERFIPLMDGEGGRKLPVVKYNEEKLDLYAFYKGDSAVSGDYFDYRKLDDHWYVFIKCDISGHGVPAALLVSVVATKFKDFYYFNNWNYAKNGINLKKFVSAVNDFIFELGTRGKFSTINISLYNKETGELYICNAGDNKIHILDGKTKSLKEIVLSNTPTAGGVSTDLVEMTAGGYKVEKTVLNHGDVLYLYTDGIDEAERLVRDRNFEVKQTVKEEMRMNKATGKEEKVSQILDIKEQFGEKRVAEVIEAVLKRQKFVLTKQDNPTPSEILEFDFTNCKGTIDESIIALAAVERVFRMIKTPDVKVDDEIEVDKVVDDFLQNHFTLYSKYCQPVPTTALTAGSDSAQEEEKQKQLADPNVTKYAYILEDKQADDITLIAIKRP